jgi:hypothetical protein
MLNDKYNEIVEIIKLRLKKCNNLRTEIRLEKFIVKE